MTFIAGFIYKTTICIIADSAETVIFPFPLKEFSKANHPQSSFYESAYIEDNKLIYEGAQKLYQIDNRIVLAFAGNVATGLQAIDEFKLRLLKGLSIKETIQELFNNHKYSDNHFIVGYFENEKPIIFYYLASDDFHFIEEAPEEFDFFLCVAGNTKGPHSSVCFHSLENAAANNLAPEEATIILLACLQGVNINERNIVTGIGGYFNGILLEKTGVRWISDTIYFLYSAKDFDKGQKYAIHKFNRDDATFLISLEKNIFKSEFSSFSRDELIEKWDETLVKIASQMSEKYFICISYDQYNAVILDTTKGNSPINADGTTRQLSFSPWAYQSMLYYPFRERIEPPSLHAFNNFFFKNVLNNY